MENLKFRWAKKSDRSAIERLWQQCFEAAGDNWYQWYFLHAYNEKNVWLALLGDEVVGMLHCHPQVTIWNDELVDDVLIMGVAVDERYRRLGIMPTMLTVLEAEARQKGWQLLRLTAQRPIIYQRLGWQSLYWRVEYTWPREMLLKMVEYFSCAERADYDDLAKIYINACKNFCGWRQRTLIDWQRRISEWQATGAQIYSLPEVEGYCVIERECNNILNIIEYVAPRFSPLAIPKILAEQIEITIVKFSLPALAIKKIMLPHNSLAPMLRPWMLVKNISLKSKKLLKSYELSNDNIFRAVNFDESP